MSFVDISQSLAISAFFLLVATICFVGTLMVAIWGVDAAIDAVKHCGK